VIGVGRIARGHDMAETFKYDHAQILAVCDVDSKRLERRQGSWSTRPIPRIRPPWDGARLCDYHELLAPRTSTRSSSPRPTTSTPSWPSTPCKAGKDVYLQKPASLTIAEGRPWPTPWRPPAASCRSARSSARRSRGRSSAARASWSATAASASSSMSRSACRATRPAPRRRDAVPPNLNYDAWLGSTPEAYYTEIRVHPQDSFDRPGWLRCEQFGAGMITGWGAHHVDTAHWGMDMEHSGPVEIWGSAEFPTSGLWNVHGKFLTHARYANGVTMDISGDFPNGVKFIGTKGWIFVARDAPVTSSDPKLRRRRRRPAASDPKILDSVIGPNEIHLCAAATEQHGDWLDSIRTSQAARPPRSRSATAPARPACCITRR
jgi:predicted dehydrogenase